MEKTATQNEVSAIGNLNFGCPLNDTTQINTIELAESDRPEESPL